MDKKLDEFNPNENRNYQDDNRNAYFANNRGGHTLPPRGNSGYNNRRGGYRNREWESRDRPNFTHRNEYGERRPPYNRYRNDNQYSDRYYGEQRRPPPRYYNDYNNNRNNNYNNYYMRQNHFQYPNYNPNAFRNNLVNKNMNYQPNKQSNNMNQNHNQNTSSQKVDLKEYLMKFFNTVNEDFMILYPVFIPLVPGEDPEDKYNDEENL